MCDCQHLGGEPSLVTDSGSGDVVCRTCGVVVEAHIFDERLEFYSEDAGARADVCRDWLLPARPIVLDRGGPPCRRRRLASNADPHAPLRELFDVIDWLGRTLSRDVRDTAKLLCRDLATQRPIRCDARHLHAAAALYLATKMRGHGIGRSKKEIAAQFGAYGVTEHGITATAKLFKDALHGEAYAAQLFRGLDAADLVNRCVERLGLGGGEAAAVKKAAHELVGRVPAAEAEGKTPCSVCSGAVACALQRLGIRLRKNRVASSCCVSGATLEKMTRMVGEWTAQPA